MKSDPKFNGRYVEGAGGTRLFVEEIGDRARPSILWLHAYCQCRLSWDKQFESDLTQQFHLVRMDIRGHGLSDKPSDPEAFTDGKNWADDIHAVITALELKKPVMCGWSYGGYIMCDYIRHYGQDHVGGLIFVDAVTEQGDEASGQWIGTGFLQLIPGLFSRDFAEGSVALQRFLELVPYEPFKTHDFYLTLGYNAVTLPASRQGMFSRQLDNKELMQSLTIPTLIVQGNDDRLVLPTYADHIARHIRHAKRVDYPKCGHAPFAEMPERFNRDVTEFMHAVHL
jgi:non-heme chloroperoxidase